MPILLITRPEPAAQRFLDEVTAELGAAPSALISPLTAIAPLEAKWTGPSPAALVLTSENAARRAGALGLTGLPAYCVGARTAQAANEAGLVPRSADGDAAKLLEMILQEAPKGRLLYLRGEDVSAPLADKLGEAGLTCDEVIVYRQVQQPLTSAARAAMAGAMPVLVPLFSARGAAALADAAQGGQAPLHLVAISQTVATAAAAIPNVEIAIAARPDAPAMAAATAALWRKLLGDARIA
ncbi:MAG: uroporphyrinogen-III synthase [Limimaricola sp.]|uniref:uroporphyrinogen-III synthase n=1 Tax=Limimaricola sp. TaxID=2211665 RepID=UPI001DA3A758|nr:uroporphyrinogen-III synthase [Limimaricola sp.]MBI1417247.1 uroporphyrinogen-III synthase [Limimaricola sp.]